jgi:hypothetical protein
MHQVVASEILDLTQYEKQRPEYRRRIIELKKNRRVQVGPSVTFVFENHQTALFQIQEMIRTERIVDDAAIQHEIDTYNQLLPEENQLAATMLIELQDPIRIREEIIKFYGINNGAVTYLQIGDEIAPGIFDLGQSDDQRISAVQYVRFPFTPTARANFIRRKSEVSLVIDHPNYRHRTVIGGEALAELAKDCDEDEDPEATR